MKCCMSLKETCVGNRSRKLAGRSLPTTGTAEILQKEKPTFVKPDSETQKREIRAFFDRECETHRYLPGYEGYVTRQLYHMVYLGKYTVDIQRLLKRWYPAEKREPYYILFDYKNRNLLNYAAAERILTMDEFTGTP